MTAALPARSDFYDQLAPLYHLVYADWQASIGHQGEQLRSLIEAARPGARRVLDVACGIGTQALGLAQQGYEVTASDLSVAAVERAQREARTRGLSIRFAVADMRRAALEHGGGFDAVVCADNSLPHLLSDADITGALRQMHACLQPGGAIVVTVRDYAREERGRNLVKPHGVRIEGDRRYVLFQVWDFEGDLYDLRFFILEESLATGAVTTHVMRSRYYAIDTGRLIALMQQAGFTNVSRIDGAFFQPVLLGTRT